MLALALGKTVRQLLSEIDSRELSEWLVWAKHHPIDDRRDDARFALVCSTMANLWGRSKGDPPFEIKQFMPVYGEPEKPPECGHQSGKEIVSLFLGACGDKVIFAPSSSSTRKEVQ